MAFQALLGRFGFTTRQQFRLANIIRPDLFPLVLLSDDRSAATRFSFLSSSQQTTFLSSYTRNSHCSWLVDLTKHVHAQRKKLKKSRKGEMACAALRKQKRAEQRELCVDLTEFGELDFEHLRRKKKSCNCQARNLEYCSGLKILCRDQRRLEMGMLFA